MPLSNSAPIAYYQALVGTHRAGKWHVQTLPWCAGVSDINELNYKLAERTVVPKAPFLTGTENFDTKAIVKLYMDVADSCMFLLWLTDRDAEKKSDW